MSDDQPSELWDAAVELFESELLRAHPKGQTIYSPQVARHLRLNFNAWGTLDVICSKFVVAV